MDEFANAIEELQEKMNAVVAAKEARIAELEQWNSTCLINNADLEARIAKLETAIIQTLNENSHLADGDDCTLIELKRIMPEAKSEQTGNTKPVPAQRIVTPPLADGQRDTITNP